MLKYNNNNNNFELKCYTKRNKFLFHYFQFLNIKYNIFLSSYKLSGFPNTSVIPAFIQLSISYYSVNAVNPTI